MIMVQELMPLYCSKLFIIQGKLPIYHMLSSNIHIFNTNSSDTYYNRDLRHFNSHMANHTSKFVKQFEKKKCSLHHCLSCYFMATALLNPEMILQTKLID